MLLDENRRKVEIVEVTEEQWKATMHEIQRRIIELLTFIEDFLKINNSERICAGLHTFAIEEYGKLLVLKTYNPSNGKVQIKYRTEFTNHYAKFSKAFEHLPQECTLYKGGFDRKGFQEGFELAEVGENYARQAIFYTDFQDLSGHIKPVLSVDKNLLQRATTSLKSVVVNEAMPS